MNTHGTAQIAIHGPIEINVRISGSVAVYLSVLMQSCSIYFDFHDFDRIRICIFIRTIGIPSFSMSSTMCRLRQLFLGGQCHLNLDRLH